VPGERHLADLLALTPQPAPADGRGRSVARSLGPSSIELLESDETAVADADDAGSGDESPALDLSIKTASIGPIRMYCTEIGKVPLLTIFGGDDERM
jgi:hypothetical protein